MMGACRKPTCVFAAAVRDSGRWYEKPNTIRCSTPCSAAFLAMRLRTGNPFLTAVSIAMRSPASM